MGQMKQQLIHDIATALKSYGFTVYLAKSKEYGFYTDGKQVVCFGGTWEFSVDYSGNYTSQNSGTGWQIVKEGGIPTKEEARNMIRQNAPAWATSENVIYTTPERHLKTYGASSGYFEFTGEINHEKP